MRSVEIRFRHDHSHRPSSEQCILKTIFNVRYTTYNTSPSNKYYHMKLPNCLYSHSTAAAGSSASIYKYTAVRARLRTTQPVTFPICFARKYFFNNIIRLILN